MEPEFISTLYTVYMTLADSNHLLFERINNLEKRINSINIVEHKYGNNLDFYNSKYHSTIR